MVDGVDVEGITMRKIRLLSVVYGERYINLFHKVCLRSLWQPGNLPALLNAGRQIEHLVITPFSNKYVWNYKSPNYKVDCVWYGDKPNVQTYAIKEWLKMCVDDGSLAMIANPDWFFADGSVSNLVNYLNDRNFSVAGLYTRINDLDFLKELKKQPDRVYSSSMLVDSAFLHPHHVLKYADVTKDSNHSAYSGHFIQPISQGLWTMNIRLAHVFLASVNVSDVEHYDGCKEMYGQAWWDSNSAAWWDSLWPSHIYKQGRFKFLQSSDLFFCVDLTKPDMGLCKVMPDMLLNDDCLCDGRDDPCGDHKARLHPEACKTFVGILRGTLCK